MKGQRFISHYLFQGLTHRVFFFKWRASILDETGRELVSLTYSSKIYLTPLECPMVYYANNNLGNLPLLHTGTIPSMQFQRG
jgi:hypothetical protein